MSFLLYATKNSELYFDLLSHCIEDVTITKENKFFESIKTGPVACRFGIGMICSWVTDANHQPTGVSCLVMLSKIFYLVCPFFYTRTCISKKRMKPHNKKAEPSDPKRWAQSRKTFFAE